MPEDVAALVHAMTDDSVTVTLVNLNATEARVVAVQGGAYGEHQLISVGRVRDARPVNGRAFKVRLAAGAGTKLMIKMKRFANSLR